MSTEMKVLMNQHSKARSRLETAKNQLDSVELQILRELRVLAPTLVAEIHAEAEFQGIGANQFIRVATYNELSRLDKQRVEDAYRENKPIKTRKKTASG